MNENKSKFKFSYIFILLIVILLCVLIFSNNGSPGIALQSSQVIDMVRGEYQNADGKTEQVVEIVFNEGNQTGYILVEGSNLKDIFPNSADYHFYYNNNLYETITGMIVDGNINITYDTIPAGVNVWDIIFPILYIAFGLFLVFMIFRMISGSNKGAMSFGKSRARAYTTSKIRFDDVAGTEEEKEQARFVTSFLDIYENSFNN